MSWIKYIADAAHYNEVLSRVASVKSSLWIGTADIKDLYVDAGAGQEPFLGELARLIERGVDVRLIHAKEPGPIFREEFDRYPVLATRLERALCPRVHFKIMVFDCKTAYVGSAQFRGRHTHGRAVPGRLCHGPFRRCMVRNALQRLRPPEILR